MPTTMRLVIAVLAGAVLLAACGGDDAQIVSNSDSGSDDAARSEASQEIPDACTFLDREEISAAIGRELREGESESAVEGTSECRFETATEMEASTTYDDPVIPETTLGSVTISTHPADPEEFDAFQESLGSEAETMTGIGDDAYVWGPDLIYVRVGDRGFSIRISADESDDQALHAALLELAERGVASYSE